MSDGRMISQGNIVQGLAPGTIYRSERGELRPSTMLEGDSLTLIPTLSCNERCVMCPQQKDETDIARISKIVARTMDYSRVGQVYITGGEPCLARTILEEIIDSIPGDIEVSILTNATLDLLSSSFLLRERLRFCIPLYASVSDLHNRIVGFAGFYKVITNLFHLGNNNVMIELRNVITKLNYRNLPLYAHYVYNNLPFVANVAFMGIELMAEARENSQGLWVDPSEYAPFLLEAVAYLEDNGIQCDLFNMPLCTLPPELWAHYVTSISPWKRVYSHLCEDCAMKNRCGGMFFSSMRAYEKSLRPS
jgi:Predicted Fe-S oxidoreductases